MPYEIFSITFSFLDQILEINKFAYAKMVCSDKHIDSVPMRAMEILSDSNPAVSCESLQKINLSLWKEQ